MNFAKIPGRFAGRKCGALGAALWCLRQTAMAADSAATAISPAGLPNAGVSLLRVAGSLIFVIALFLGFVWLLRNWQRFLVHRGRAPRLNILEVRSLGSRNSLYVVGYEQERFLIATSPAGVNLLTHLASGAPSADTEATAPASGPVASFQQALAHVLKGK